MDEVVEAADSDPWAQAHADWAWFRFATACVLIRERGAGPVAAALARGLLEQAAYWDWALATGAGPDHLVSWAAIEYKRLSDVAAAIDDEVWMGWVLPPGATLVASTAEGIPKSAGDAVKRIGSGLAAPVIGPLRFQGLFAANRLLDVLTHGNLAAALVMAPGGGEELPDALAAAVAHVAATGATAVVLSYLDPPTDITCELTQLAAGVAEVASRLHGLPLSPTTVARGPARARRREVLDVRSDIERMHPAAPSTDAAAKQFLAASHHLAQVATTTVRMTDVGSAGAWTVFQLAWGQLHVLEGAVEGTLARALLPFAARALLEDGARWEWVRRRAVDNPSGDSLRALVSESKRQIDRVVRTMAADGIPDDVVQMLLGFAGDLTGADPGRHEMPSVAELLSVAYPNPSGVDSARPMYGVLSQFVHATPLSVLHLQRDDFPSLTAPVYAIAVEAACRGFWNIATTTLVIACEGDERLGPAMDSLAVALRAVVSEAAIWHFLG